MDFDEDGPERNGLFDCYRTMKIRQKSAADFC
jgi:hypothetical protein